MSDWGLIEWGLLAGFVYLFAFLLTLVWINRGNE